MNTGLTFLSEFFRISPLRNSESCMFLTELAGGGMAWQDSPDAKKMKWIVWQADGSIDDIL